MSPMAEKIEFQSLMNRFEHLSGQLVIKQNNTRMAAASSPWQKCPFFRPRYGAGLADAVNGPDRE